MQMTITDVLQKINLLEGVYSTTEAVDIMNQLIDVKINHHKLQILSMRIHNDHAITDLHDSRIKELMEEKSKLKAYVSQAKAEGKQVQMNSQIEISFI